MTVESMANSRELASACEKLSMITGLHPGQPLSSHLDKLVELREADRDRLESEVRKTDALLIQALTKRDHFRDRCPVEASDVEAAGVCRRRAVVWAEAHAPELARSLEHVWSKTDGPQTLAIDINAVSEAVGRPAMKILDEMAAMVPK